MKQIGITAPCGDRTSIAAMSDVHLEACGQLAVDAFVERFSPCIVQERDLSGVGPMDFELRQLGEFYAANRAVRAQWSPDDYGSPYVFHDLCTNAGSREEFDVLFDEYPPSEEFIEASESLPCCRATVTLGGPNSFTSLHSHGAAACLLLAGEKRWSVWQPEVAPILRWLMAGLRVRNRFALWEQSIEPALAAARGDGFRVLVQVVEALEATGTFVMPPSDHPTTAHIRRLRGDRSPRPTVAQLRGRHITQAAGQALYLPQGWTHAVRNTRWHVAFVYEFPLQPQASSAIETDTFFAKAGATGCPPIR